MSKAYHAYAESDTQTIEGDKKTILQAIRYYHEVNIEPGARDLEQLTTINHSTIRDAIIELREEYNIPIANLGTGYFIVTNPDSLQRVVDHYNGVIETKEDRKQSIVKAYNVGRANE